MRSRIARPLLWVVVPAVLIVSGMGVVRVDATPRPSVTDEGVAPPATSQPEPRSVVRPASTSARAYVDPRGEPTRVVIPAIDVDVDLVRLGLNDDGSMEVPAFGLAGWYVEGPMPGHAGPAVIVAHVDSRAGPDVFHRLGDLTAGDEIRVVYGSGDVVTFVANRSEEAPKEELPVASIWPTTDERLLTLITCGGEFDRSAGHYRDNLMVYTSWVQRQSGRAMVRSRL